MQQLPHWQWQQQRQGSLGSLQQRRSPAASDVAARPRLDLTKRFTAPVLVAFDTNVLLEQEGRKLVMDWAQLVERTGLGMVQLLMPQVGGRTLYVARSTPTHVLVLFAYAG